MFKKYGIIGAILIILVQISFIFNPEFLGNWYSPIVWLGYILLIDALVYKIKGKSLIKNRPLTFAGLFILSIFFWGALNWFLQFTNSWEYVGFTKDIKFGFILSLLKDAIILPAIFETFDLIKSIHLFDKIELKKKHKISKKTLYILIGIGILFFFAPIFLPSYFFPVVWLSFFFILDPINYIRGQPSILRYIKNKKLKVPLSLGLSGLIVGFLFEFWNFWAVPKWVFNLPNFLNFFKIFEMPILGYAGYVFWAFEFYAMYWFTKSLFNKSGKTLK